MKKISLVVAVCFTCLIGYSQTDGISYQAVIIDNNPQEIPGVDIPSNNLPNTALQIQFTIIDNTTSIEYQEIQRTTTDPFGMINLMIGQGDASIGTFNQIYWNNDKFLKVEIDLNDGNGFIEFSYQELTYIPYVKHREIIATSTLDVDGVTNLNSSFNVNNASPSHLTGDLRVDGNTNLNGTLTVFNQEPTLLTGDLTVEGLVSFDGELAVGGDTNLYSDLTVEGTSFLNGDLNVLGQANFNDGTFQNITVTQNSNLNLLNVSGTTILNSTLIANGITYLNGGLYIDEFADISGSLTVSETSRLNGQVIIDADINGGQTNADAYPLLVKGSNQGVSIRVDGVSNNTRNFMLFSDASGIKGGIEGQSLNDLRNSFEYSWEMTLFFIDLAFITAEGLACAAQLDLGEAGIMAANSLTYGIHYQAQDDYQVDNRGVYFKSGGADYAEYLEKEYPNAIFRKGDVVGVKAGKISKNTLKADHVMVISSNPIVLGNLPVESLKSKFEKVAFLGQVPVRVVGKVKVGDYILPSQNNDGLGVTISPEHMKIDDYKNILGVAWEASYNNTMSVINVAVGINTNDIALQVKKQQEEINTIKQQLQNVINRLDGKELVVISDKENTHNAKPNNNDNAYQFSDADLSLWQEIYGYIFENYMEELKKEFKTKGIDYTKYPEIVKFVDTPKETFSNMFQGQYMPTLWQSFIKRYPAMFNKY